VHGGGADDWARASGCQTPPRRPAAAAATRLAAAAAGTPRHAQNIAVFPILADVVEVKTGSWSTTHWSNDFIRLNGWLRTCFAQLITPLDIDGIGQNWEESNKTGQIRLSGFRLIYWLQRLL